MGSLLQVSLVAQRIKSNVGRDFLSLVSLNHFRQASSAGQPACPIPPLSRQHGKIFSPAKSYLPLKCWSGCWHQRWEITGVFQMKALHRLLQSPTKYNGIFTRLKAGMFGLGMLWIRPTVD